MCCVPVISETVSFVRRGDVDAGRWCRVSFPGRDQLSSVPFWFCAAWFFFKLSNLTKAGPAAAAAAADGYTVRVFLPPGPSARCTAVTSLRVIINFVSMKTEREDIIFQALLLIHSK